MRNLKKKSQPVLVEVLQEGEDPVSLNINEIAAFRPYVFIAGRDSFGIEIGRKDLTLVYLADRTDGPFTVDMPYKKFKALMKSFY